nr:four helix bundle protein [uncultured Mucilaginibacter sp.]
MTGTFKELKVYQSAFEAARNIFHLSKKFPKEETYALTDQIRRSSRSVCTNIGEGYRKRIYPKHFTSKMTDADGEATETSIWLTLHWIVNISTNKNSIRYE